MRLLAFGVIDVGGAVGLTLAGFAAVGIAQAAAIGIKGVADGAGGGGAVGGGVLDLAQTVGGIKGVLPPFPLGVGAGGEVAVRVVLVARCITDANGNTTRYSFDPEAPDTRRAPARCALRRWTRGCSASRARCTRRAGGPRAPSGTHRHRSPAARGPCGRRPRRRVRPAAGCRGPRC